MKKLLIYFIIVTVFFSCSKAQDSTPQPGPGNPGGNSGNPPTSDWLIPKNEVHDGGPGKDGIPALEEPEFISVNQVEYLNDDDLVLGFKSGDEVKAYPHKILDWHEIINDKVGTVSVAVTYCPLTGTGIGWNRVVDGKGTTFGVSGLLYNSNLIPYDRSTGSNWSQMRLDCVNGPLQSTKISTYQLIETTWETWKRMYPNSSVVSTNTSYNRNYNRYPYGDYLTNNSYFIFPVKPEDDRLPSKERVLGIITDKRVKAFRFSNFDAQDISLRQEEIGEIPVVIIGSKKHDFMISYQSRTSDVEGLEFTVLQGEDVLKNGALVSDQYGNVWNIFGEAIEGPQKGQELMEVESYMGFWFAWGAFYPELAVQLK